MNFYRNPKYPIDLIDKITQLENDEKIKLLITRQVHDEFYRNLESVKKQVVISLEANKSKFDDPVKNIPHIIQNIIGLEDINKLKDKFQIKIENAIKNYKKKVNNPKSHINLKIKKLFNREMIEASTDLIHRAHFRTLKGNPPLKDKYSFGDAINWETILENSDLNLIVISNDGDFESPTNQGKLNEFLLKEWKENSEKEIHLYKTLSKFLNEEFGEGTASEQESAEENLIKTENPLINSHIYSDTLNIYPSENNPITFTQFPAQINSLTFPTLSGSSSLTPSFEMVCAFCNNHYTSSSLPGSINICPQCGYSSIT